MVKDLTALRKFYNGKSYPILVSILIVCGHFFSRELIFGSVIILSMTLGCLVAEDLRFAILPIMGAIFIVSIDHSPNVPDYSDYFIRPYVLIVFAILALFLLAGLGIFAFRKRAERNKLVLTPTLAGLLVLCLAITPNGLGNSNYVIYNFLYCSSFYLSLVGIYLLFYLYLPRKREILDYAMGCFLLCGTIICAELLLAWCNTVRFDEGGVVKESVLLGWGVWTAIGGMLAFLLPSCFYLSVRRKHGWICYLLGTVQFFCILLSQSRGALVVGSIVFFASVLLSCLVGPYKKRNRRLSAFLALLALCVAVLKREELYSLLSNFFRDGFSNNGRFALWKIGVEKFLQHPLFGAGFYDSFVNEEWKKSVYPYLYHNTVIQLLGACGTLGLVGYAAHRLLFFRLLLRRISPYKAFLGIGIIGLLLFSLLDVLFFHTYPTIFYSLMLFCMEQSDCIENVPQSEPQ